MKKAMTIKRREELETQWLAASRPYYQGRAICLFLGDYDSELGAIFKPIWRTTNSSIMSHYFQNNNYRDELTYLCRALTLNILLNDAMETK